MVDGRTQRTVSKENGMYKKLLVAVDGSDISLHAFKEALGWGSPKKTSWY